MPALSATCAAIGFFGLGLLSAAEPQESREQRVNAQFQALRREFRVASQPDLPDGGASFAVREAVATPRIVQVDQFGRVQRVLPPSPGVEAPPTLELAQDGLRHAAMIFYEDRVEIARTIIGSLNPFLAIGDGAWEISQNDTLGNRISLGLSFVPIFGSTLSKAARPLLRTALGAGRLSRSRFATIEEALAKPPHSLDDQLEYGPQLAHLSRESGEHAYFKLVGELEGVPVETIESIKKLGSQGLEQTCARYAVAACAAASGVNLTPDEAKRISGELLQETFQARLNSPKTLARYYRGGSQSSDERIYDHLQMMDHPNMSGLATGEMMETARRAGLSARNLDVGLTVDKTYASAFWGSGDRARFFSESKALRDQIEDELKQGRAVVASISHHAERPSNHAITVLARGQNAQGAKLALIYDSEHGGVDLIPWDYFFPRTAVVITAK
ncbi:MAG: hypothetical protein AAB036_11320 [Elusimicrobiota bacterium]